LELRRVREELDSPSFRGLYRRLREAHPLLDPFPTPFDLTNFFHQQNKEYEIKDTILTSLILDYRQGPPYDRLAIFFIVLFTPSIVKTYAIARKRLFHLEPDEILQQISLFVLQELKTGPVAQIKEKTASRITGRVRNLMRRWVSERIREASGREEVSEDQIYQPLPVVEKGGTGVDLEDAIRFLDFFVKERVITERDKLVILGSKISKRPLAEIAGGAGSYQKIKKRRQRAIEAMEAYLQEIRKASAKGLGLSLEDITIPDLLHDLLKKNDPR